MTSQSVQFPLDPGERQLWAGYPRQGIVLRASDAGVIPFTCMWAGFAVYWELTVVRLHAPFFLPLWGVPFLLVGVYIVVGRFFVDAWRRARTVYAVTSERVIIARGGPASRVISLPLATLSDVTLNERSDGSGTITFGPAIARQLFTRGPLPGAGPQVPAFEMVAGARSICEVIRSAQKAASERAS